MTEKLETREDLKLLKRAVDELEAKLDRAVERSIDGTDKNASFISGQVAGVELAIRLLKQHTQAEEKAWSIRELQKAVHENAVAHGWWDGIVRQFGELIALCHSELSEALEAYREDAGYDAVYIGHDGKPEGIPTELADVVIRVMDMCEFYGIDLEKEVLRKHEFNKSRPYKHGNKKI